jgi:F-box and WD-40 domain protein 1/11
MTRVLGPEDTRQSTARYASPFVASPSSYSTGIFMNDESQGIRRKRLLSLPLLGQEDDLVEKVRRSFHLGRYPSDYVDHSSHSDRQWQNTSSPSDPREPEGEGKAKRRGSIRALIRRASTAVRTRRNTNSWTSSFPEVPESRPLTSSRWNRLRQAASFRHSKAGFEFENLVDSCETLVAPIPGFGNAPPVIPRNSGGAAARATAALQNEHLERTRHFLDVEDSQGDRESGVGIAVTVSNQSQYQDESINRVDFITALPIELAIQVLSHLDHRGLSQAALVSRDWLRISSTSHVWREAFCREKSLTYAMSGPIIPGTGFGLPTVQPDKPWKDIYRVRHELEANWRGGKAKPVYLNGHLDSIYCVQFDE